MRTALNATNDMNSTMFVSGAEICEKDSTKMNSDLIKNCHQSGIVGEDARHKTLPLRRNEPLVASSRQTSGNSEISYSMFSDTHCSIGSQSLEFFEFTPFTAYPTLFPYAVEAGGDDMIFGGSMLDSQSVGSHSYVFKSGHKALMMLPESCGTNNRRSLSFPEISDVMTIYEGILEKPLNDGTLTSGETKNDSILALPLSHSINTPPAALDISAPIHDTKIVNKAGAMRSKVSSNYHDTKGTQYLPTNKHQCFNPIYKTCKTR